MKFKITVVGIFFGLLLYPAVMYLTSNAMAVGMLLAGNPAATILAGVYTLVMTGVVIEIFLECEPFILGEEISLSKVFVKTAFIFALIYALGTFGGNKLQAFMSSNAYSGDQRAAYAGFGMMGIGAVMIFFTPFIARFFVLTPLRDRAVRGAFSGLPKSTRSSSSKSDRRRL